VGEYAGLLWSPDGTGIRTLEGDYTCPRDITGEVHDDGMPLSAALWAARQSLDASLLDQAVYDGLAGSERTMGLADIAELILLAVGDTLGQEARDTLLAELEARGVMDCEPIRPIEPVDLETSVFDFAYLYGKDLWGAADPVPATLQWSYEVPDGYYEVTVRTFQVQTKGVPLVDYGRDLAPQPLVFYSRGGEAITHSYSSNAAGTLAIGTIADDTVEASATDTILENDRYFFYEYEAQFVVAGPATYHLQVANGGATSTYAVDLYMGFEETAAPEGTSFNYPDEGGCGGCGRGGEDKGSFAGLFVVMLALLPLARGGRRGRR